MLRARRAALLLVLACPTGAAAQPDLLLKGGQVVDGSGSPARRLDVAIHNGRIVRLQREVEAAPGYRVIDARGRTITPGFIDLHNHSQRGLREEPDVPSQTSQGITTLLIGPDGSSPFPAAPYRKALQEQPVAVNVGLLVGHGTIRRLVLGDDFRRVSTPAEVAAMASLVEVAMQQGAFGLSSGLEYDPGFYSATEELIELAKVASRYAGIYMTHIRDEEDGFVDAIREAIRIGREARLPVQISHLKLGNTRVWGRTAEALDLIHEAIQAGVDVAADCYPYNAWSSSLSILVPTRQYQDREEIALGFEKVGGADKVLITRFKSDRSLEFKTVAEIAAQSGTSAVEVFLDLMDRGGAGVVCESMHPADVDAFYTDPAVMVSSDGGTDSRHPRKAGTFPRVLGRFVRERGLLSLPEAVRKMTSLPASRLGLKDRGTIAIGMRADLVVFLPDTIIDRATFQNPDQLSEGIDYTLVNGVVVWENGQPTGQRPGSVLRNH